MVFDALTGMLSPFRRINTFLLCKDFWFFPLVLGLFGCYQLQRHSKNKGSNLHIYFEN